MSNADQLAINGGPPVRTDPLPPRRLFGEEEKQAVLELFDAAIAHGHELLGYNGPQEEAYCREFAEFLGGGFADGVNSGTNALYVALRALGIEPFTEVVVPAVTDPGAVMPVALSACIPVPADCAPESYNVGAEQIEARITERTSAIIVAHIAGFPADMDPIMELADSRGIPVIEDCAQAHGATYGGRPVGSIGDVAFFSLMFGKHHASGGQGGMIFTRNEDLYWRIRRCADRGKPFGMESPEGNVIAALNCNMDELHATTGRTQLRKLPAVIEKRRSIAAAIAKGCRSLRTVRLARGIPQSEAVYWFLPFEVDLEQLSADKAAFVEALNAEGIPAAPSYLVIPTRMPWCRDRLVFGSSGLPWGWPPHQTDTDNEFDLLNIETTDARHIHLDFHENWTQQEVADVLAALAKVEAAYLA